MDDAAAGVKPLRVAVIGYGLAGRIFHSRLIDSTPGMTVVAIVSRNWERRAAAAMDFPNASLYDDASSIWQHPGICDLVVVATPNRLHVQFGLAAIEAGIPVVIDKPIATTVEGAEQLITASQSGGVPLTVFQNRRWDGDFLTVQALLDGGLLGKPVRFESRFDRFRPEPRPGAWRESDDPDEGGGLLLDLGSHLIDQAIQLFGPPRSVYAEVRRSRPFARVDDDTFIALECDPGVQAHLWMNVVVRTPGARFFVNGLHGSYTKYGLDPQEAALREGRRPSDPRWGLEPEDAWGRLSTEVSGVHFDGKVETLAGRYEDFYSALRDALLRGGPMPVDPSNTLTSLRVIEAARRSAAERRVVEIDAEVGRVAGGSPQSH